MKKKRLLSWFLAMVMVLGLLPMTVWAEEMLPFTAMADGESLKIEKSEEKYIYSDWNGNGEVDLFEVIVPAETGSVSLNFNGEKFLAYGYNRQGRYVTSYGEYGNNGEIGHEVAVIEGTYPYCVWVQTPYVGWDSELKFVIKLNYEGIVADDTKTDPASVDIDALMKNIAESYVNRGDDFWVTLGMAAYKDMVSDSFQMENSAKQKYINMVIETVTREMVKDTDYANAVLALTALSVDAEELYTLNDTENAVSAVAGLLENRANHSIGTWDAPFILAAYNQKDYKGAEQDENTDAYETALIKEILKTQKDNGCWIDSEGTNWEECIQATANMIAGLAFYYPDNEEVKEAIDSAVTYLSKEQKADGSFDAYGYGADANTMAMVVIGLSSVGIDPATDSRFIKNGNSVLDALLGFSLKDGFWYGSNEEVNDYATKQAFLALIAASRVEDSYGEAFNIYDFSHNTELKAGYFEKVEDNPSVDIPTEDEEEIIVTVSIDANGDNWLDEYVSVAEDATVYDAFMKALKGSGIKQKGASSGYIESMTKDGVTLGEFDEGENSGWLYKVNDELPDVGIKDYYLDDGDDILFYYTKDWKSDPDAGFRFEEIPEEEEAAGNVSDLIDKIGEVTLESADAIKAAREAYDALTDEEKVLVENYDLLLAAEALLAELLAAQEQVVLPAIEEIFTDMSADSYCYEAVQWAVVNGIVSGVTETGFGPEWECSRGQLMTLIWRLMGKPEPRTQTVPYADVDKGMYYHDAILWAVENKLANGTDSISFSPEMTLTRGQAVAFLWRAAGMPEPAGTHTFTDVTDTDYYAKAVQWAEESGITSGTGDGCFSPDAPCTRGQIVTFLYRCFGK